MMNPIFTESTRHESVWVKALRNQGYRIEEAKVNGKLLIRMINPTGGVWLTGKKMAYPMNSYAVYEIADNKRYAYDLADSLGIPTPQSTYYEVGAPLGQALDFLENYKRVVVKPLDSYHSKGVSLNITDSEQLDTALKISQVESPTAIIQEQIEGEEYRFTVLNGEVVSVLRRERPQVIGDGVSTVEALVAKENALRDALPEGTMTYPFWTEALFGDIVGSQEVLPEGEMKLLSNVTLVSRGASVYELLNEVHESYIKDAKVLASATGAGFIAVDMFILDHTQPAARGGYWFNECNAAPSLKMYSTPRNADIRYIADDVISMTVKYLNIL